MGNNGQADETRRRRRFAGWILVAGLLVSALGIIVGCSPATVIGGPQATATATETPIPTETPGPTPTPDPVRADDIVYVRRYVFGLSGDLYLIHPTGLAPRQITSFTRDQLSVASDYPVWSADRSKIAYSSEYRDLYNLAVWNLYTIDPQGHGSQQITGLPQPNNGYIPDVLSKIPGVPAVVLSTAPPGAPVHGRVLANGQPVAGAVVFSWLGRNYTRTAADGTYTLNDVPPDQRGWIKAKGEAGSGWDWLTPRLGADNRVPDIALDPQLDNEEFQFPATDPRGGMWSLLTRHWFEPTTQAVRYETTLAHISPDGNTVLEVATALNKTMGRPRANPAQPEQVAAVDGTDLVLLTTDLTAPDGKRLITRRVLQRNVLLNAPVAWSPAGDRLYYVQPVNFNQNTDAGYESLRELTLASGAVREVTFFWPKERENTGFDLSPDGTQVVYEEYGDLFIRALDAPQSAKPRHITYFGQSLHPTWGGR